MKVKELIEKLKASDPNVEVFISCEGGCVIDNDIEIIFESGRILLEI
ncbi:hypothetical protein [Sediminibacillus massiliensis]|nr:hypothetical protein [Sediminibacillus massiliensis]